jgi:hypothetical protein
LGEYGQGAGGPIAGVVDQIVKAHQYVEENQKLGKVVVRVN